MYNRYFERCAIKCLFVACVALCCVVLVAIMQIKYDCETTSFFFLLLFSFLQPLFFLTLFCAVLRALLIPSFAVLPVSSELNQRASIPFPLLFLPHQHHAYVVGCDVATPFVCSNFGSLLISTLSCFSSYACCCDLDLHV